MTFLDPEIRRCLLRLFCVPDLGPVAWSRVIAAWRSGRVTLDSFLDLPAEVYRERYRLRAPAVSALTDRREEIRREAEVLEREMVARGIDLVVDRRLPSGFPMLFSYGNLELREEPAAALLASRDAEDGAIEAAERVADAVACAGGHFVTGLNRPAYKAAGVAARRRASPLTLALDRGLLSAWGEEWGREPLAPARIWDERFDTELSLAVSPFRLRDEWVTPNSRRRDQLIGAWAQVLVAVSLRPGGWLEAQCRAALARGATVLVREEEPGKASTEAAARLPGAQFLPTWKLAEAAGAALGPPGSGRRRAELRARAAFARALVTAASGEPSRSVTDRLPPEDGPAFAYAPPTARRKRKADALLVEAEAGDDLELAVIGWLGELRPGGILAALLPTAILQTAAAAAFRERLLAQGQLLAAITLPGDRGVCLLRKGGAESVLPPTPALVISPTAPLTTAAARRRYLEDALARARTALREDVTPPY